MKKGVRKGPTWLVCGNLLRCFLHQESVSTCSHFTDPRKFSVSAKIACLVIRPTVIRRTKNEKNWTKNKIFDSVTAAAEKYL